jgi:hypothetical protein
MSCIHNKRSIWPVSVGLILSALYAVNAQTLPSSGTISGAVSIEASNGTILKPSSAVVNIIYWGSSKLESSTAGEAFVAEATRAATAIAQETSKNKSAIAQESKEQRSDEFQKYQLLAVDAGLKAAKTWSIKNDHAWQMTTSDAKEGRWTQENVRTGRYKIIVRGVIGNLDGEWEGEVSVKTGETAYLPLGRLKMGRLLKP